MPNRSELANFQNNVFTGLWLTSEQHCVSMDGRGQLVFRHKRQTDGKNLKMSKICKYYQAGRCLYGDRCTFLHVDSYQDGTRTSHLKYPPEPVSPQMYTPPVRGPCSYKKPQICRFFMLGRCIYGDGCSYLHPQQTHPEARVWVRRDDTPPPQPNRNPYYYPENSPSKPADRFHFRRSTDNDGTVRTSKAESPSAAARPAFSFKQAVEEAAGRGGGQASREPLNAADFGYAPEEVYSTSAELGADYCDVYDATTEYFDVDFLPLLPPTAQQCIVPAV